MAHSNQKIVKVVTDQGPLVWVLFAAYLGGVIYFFQLDSTVWGFILAIIKAAFWPAYIIFEVLKSLGVS
jgi:uncharacterized membrane-anchored protein